MERRTKTLAGLGLGALLLALAPGSGLAHPESALLAGGAANPGPAAGLALGVVLLGSLALLARLDPRRVSAGRALAPVVSLSLAIVLSVFALETAVHSVHHLGDPASAAACPALATSHDLHWAAADPPQASAAPPVVSRAPAVQDDGVWPSPIRLPQWGRAPPA